MSKALRRAIYGKLAGDTTLNNMLGTPAPNYGKSIYHSKGPDKAGYPFVTIDRQSGIPTHAFGKPIAFEEDVWIIKAIDRALSADAADDIAARLDVLLNDAVLSISGYDLMYLRRMSAVEYDEQDSGVTYKHSGGNYRITTQGTA